ncbi:MAG: hypothetical protein H7A39_06280 [Chlamydiales bacterium]|nr:hypothetical protein [Chlamydiales bacterium]
MKRVVIIGACGSGKTTLGQAMSGKLGIAWTDLDDLFWLPGWKRRPFEEFEGMVKQTVAADTWIVCGNYSKLQHLTVFQADTVVWLDLSLGILLWRIIKRGVIQARQRTAICNGNYQSISQFWWLFKHLFKSFWKKKTRYKQLEAQATQATWVHLRDIDALNKWLAAI